MGLLDKFAAVEVDRKGSLDPADQAYCDHQDQLYREAVTFLSEVKARMEVMFASYEGDEDWNKDGYIEKHNDIRYVEQRIKDIRKSHIGKIAYYFEKKYKVSINTDTIIRELAELPDLEVTGAAIVERIYRQLGGATFEEKAVQEIKDGLARRLYGREPEIKGTRLIFAHFVYPERRYDGTPYLSYPNNEPIMALLRALQHFDTGAKEIGWPYSEVARQCSNLFGSPFTKHEIGSTKVQSVQLFLNGKVQVTFASYELAAKFAAEYTRKAA